MPHSRAHSLALGLCLWLLQFTAIAAIDGPDMYVYVEVSVREATIEGMRERLSLLQSSQYTAAGDDAVDAQTRVRIADIYSRFGTTPGLTSPMARAMSCRSTNGSIAIRPGRVGTQPWTRSFVRYPTN